MLGYRGTEWLEKNLDCLHSIKRHGKHTYLMAEMLIEYSSHYCIYYIYIQMQAHLKLDSKPNSSSTAGQGCNLT